MLRQLLPLDGPPLIPGAAVWSAGTLIRKVPKRMFGSKWKNPLVACDMCVACQNHLLNGATMRMKILIAVCLLVGAAFDYHLFKRNERAAYELGRTVAAMHRR